MSWSLGLAHLAARLNVDLQRAARAAGGGEWLWAADAEAFARALRLDGDRLSVALRSRESFDPSRAAVDLAAADVRHVRLADPGYPAALAEIHDPPFGLFVAGRPLDAVLPEAAPVVAVVGSRRPSRLGVRFASRLAGGLVERGATIVSGLAAGIDAAAHLGALDGGGATIAVVGNGVDVPYPRRNGQLRSRILRDGAIVSEYWPGTPPAPWRFPARNRIVAGIADAVVVVEAGERSGALITADFALEQGRPVLAVPGAPGGALVAGCHGLIRAGAALCERVEDVIAELPDRRWLDAPEGTPPAPGGFDGEVYGCLCRQPMRPDELVVELGRAAAEVGAALSRLELAGNVIRGDDQRVWAAPLAAAARGAARRSPARGARP